MRIVDIHDAKAQLSHLLVCVENGETITIARAGKPVADLIPHIRADIVFGVPAGRLQYDTDHFDDTDSALNALFGIG